MRCRCRHSLWQERSESEERSIGSAPDRLSARRIGDCKRNAHTPSLGRDRDAPCVERLDLVVRVDTRLLTAEANGAVW